MTERMLRSRARKTIVSATVAVTLLTSTVVHACLDNGVSNHTMALSVKTLQSDLMVSAFSCNEHALYNDFATQFQPDLQVNGATLISYFKKVYTKRSKQALNSYVTDLANFAAVCHAKNAVEFCADAESAYHALLPGEEKGDIQQIALAYAMQVSKPLKQEMLAATSTGCDVVQRGNLVAANGLPILR